jgi:hypothetical protein
MSGEVMLTWSEAAMASEIGRMRQLSAIKSGRKDSYGFEGGGWQVHIEGACGELSVAKHLGVYWDGSVDTFRRPDVGKFEVKTRSKHEYDLIVRPDSPDDWAFILVTGKCPSYIVRGWILAVDAKKEEYLQGYGGRPPAYFIPHYALMPMSEINLSEGTPRETESAAT